MTALSSRYISHLKDNFLDKNDDEIIINGYDEFYNFVVDNSNELGLGDDEEEAVEKFIQENFDEVRQYVLVSNTQWISIGKRNNWSISSNNLSAQKDLSTPHIDIDIDIDIDMNINARSAVWNEEETLWLKKQQVDLTADDVQMAEAIYKKALNSGDRVIIASCALRRAWANDKSDDLEQNRIKCWEEAADRSLKAKQGEAHRWYEQCAEIHRKHYRFSKSAKHYEKAATLLATNITSKKQRPNEKTIELYRMARKQYEMSGESAACSRVYILENDTKLKETQFIKNASLRIYKTLSNYGESPSRVAFWAAVIILLCAAIYAFTGISSSSSESTVHSFWVSLYYSVVTFTTLGYGDFSPPSSIARIVSASEAVTGLLLTSLFMVTVVRKYSR